MEIILFLKAHDTSFCGLSIVIFGSKASEFYFRIISYWPFRKSVQSLMDAINKLRI